MPALLPENGYDINGWLSYHDSIYRTFTVDTVIDSDLSVYPERIPKNITVYYTIDGSTSSFDISYSDNLSVKLYDIYLPRDGRWIFDYDNSQVPTNIVAGVAYEASGRTDYTIYVTLVKP